MGAEFAVEASISEQTGVIEDAPIIGTRTTQGTAILGSGDWLLLSGLEGRGRSRSASGLPWLAATGVGGVVRLEESETRILVLVRASRVFRSGSGQSARSPKPRAGSAESATRAGTGLVGG
jgi:type II secretory pathway component GspD/PulD (secretin)